MRPAAVMGNHEFNAIGWLAQNEDGGFLRNDSAKNANEHAKFLGQVGESPPPIRMPSTGSEPCRSGLIFPAFASSTLAGTMPRVRRWCLSWTRPAA